MHETTMFDGKCRRTQIINRKYVCSNCKNVFRSRITYPRCPVCDHGRIKIVKLGEPMDEIKSEADIRKFKWDNCLYCNGWYDNEIPCDMSNEAINVCKNIEWS
jgi:DNA-directed RNA polymerase subunit RPC12/RpoP